MTNSNHIPTNSPKGAQKRSDCEMSGYSYGDGDVDGLQIHPVSLAGAALIWRNGFSHGTALMSELGENKLASRIT